MAAISIGAVHLVDTFNGGPYSTPAGTTKNIGAPSDLPVRRRVRLHDQPTGQVVREVWSDPVTGQYQFHYLREGTYFVLVFDHTGQYGAQVEADIVLPVP